MQEAVRAAMEDQQIHQALAQVWNVVADANRKGKRIRRSAADLDKLADALQVSRHGLRLRCRELGLD